MLGKIDCKNMFNDNDNHLCCTYTGNHCNFEKGENNGMRCGSYKAKIIREPMEEFKDIIIREPYEDEMEDLNLEVIIECKDMQIESLVEFSRKLKRENLRLKDDRKELILDLINRREDYFKGTEAYEALDDVIDKLKGRE